MIASRISRSLAVCALAAACTEPRSDQMNTEAQPALAARMELSDSLPAVGSELVVSVRLRGVTAARVASFTERLSYDSTGLTYLSDVAIDDGATRVSNPSPGLIRSAGFALAGFGDSPLVAYRFRVVDPTAARRMRLTVDELHDANRANATTTVRVTERPVASVP